jgi:hypothetical protein
MVSTNRNASLKEEAAVMTMDSMIPMMDFENDDGGMLFEDIDDLDFKDITMDPAAFIPDPMLQDSLQVQLPQAQTQARLQDKTISDAPHPMPAMNFNSAAMMNLEPSPIKKKSKRKRKVTSKAAKANEEDLFAPTEKIKPKARRKRKTMTLPTSRPTSMNVDIPTSTSMPPLPLSRVRPHMDFPSTIPSSNRPRLPLNKKRKPLDLVDKQKLPKSPKSPNKKLPTRNNTIQSFDPLPIPPVVSHHPPLHSAFFPFSPLPPSIPSHFELRQQLPHLHRITKHCAPPKSSTSNSTIPPPQPPTVSHALIQLLHQYVGMKFNTSPLDGSLEHAHIEKAKNHVNASDPNLVRELQSLHNTLREQSNALTTSIRQLSMHCQDFWMDTTGHGTESLAPTGKGKRRRGSSKGSNGSVDSLSFVESIKDMALRQGVSSHVLNDVILPPQQSIVSVPTLPSLSQRWRHGSSVTVKVRMVGWKKLDTHTKPLVASFVNGSSATTVSRGNNAGVKTTKVPRKRKAGKTSTVESKSDPTKLQTKQEPKTYEQMNYLEKRTFVTKMLSERAGIFERQMNQQHVHREEMSNKREDERCKLIEKDDNRGIRTTSTLWDVMDQTSYWDDLTKKDIAVELSVAWQPTISSRPIYWGKLPTAEVLSGSSTSATSEKKRISSHSLYDRLQSLVVEEGDGSSGDESDDDSDILLDHSDQVEDDDRFFNISKLNLDQRTYLQLRSLYLIDQPLTPSSEPVAIEKNISKRMFSGRGEPDSEEEQQEEIDLLERDLEIAIQRKQLQLSQAQTQNNSTAAFLQSEANAFVEHERVKEEQNALISKHNQLVTKKAISKKGVVGRKDANSKSYSASVPH